MSCFDHDAAMRRGVERQEAIDEVLREAYDFVDRQQMVGDNEAFIRLSAALLLALQERQERRPNDAGLESMMKHKAEGLLRALVEKSMSGYECDAMALMLAKKLLESGTNQIIINMGLWESKTFREGARTPQA